VRRNNTKTVERFLVASKSTAAEANEWGDDLDQKSAILSESEGDGLSLSFPGGCCCVNKNEEWKWKTEGGFVRSAEGERVCVEWQETEAEREREALHYNGQKASRRRGRRV